MSPLYVVHRMLIIKPFVLGRQPEMVVRTPTLINQCRTNYFWMFIRGSSHGIDGTQDCLVMVRNFKDIL